MSHHSEWPKRYGKHVVVDGNPKEIGELSDRALQRVKKEEQLQTTSDENPSENPIYAELHCLSNFSFQRGASHAEELFGRAVELGYTALAITDECSLSGIVRAFEAAKGKKINLIVGTEVRLEDGIKLVILAVNHEGYSSICKLITKARLCSTKGEYRLSRTDAEQLGPNVRVLWAPGSTRKIASPQLDGDAQWLRHHFPNSAWIAVELHRTASDRAELKRLRALGKRNDLPLVAAGDVHMHVRERRALQDVLTAIRHGCTVAEAGHRLFPNGERHLRNVEELLDVYPLDLLQETLRIAEQCTFKMNQLNYQYPHEVVPKEMNGDAAAHLRDLTYKGATVIWPKGIPKKVIGQIEHELELIAYKKYENFFLTVEEIVSWARSQDPPILCQGRGSSANSTVCYCLGITKVDPEKNSLLFERFVSRERDEAPDIDVDFEHERREEVIQHVFKKYGRDRAALAATVISYRFKSAVRDVGRALGFPEDSLDQLSSISTRIPSGKDRDEELLSRGFDPASRELNQLLSLVLELRAFPRHLSQHVGGFVISERPLHELVPVENAAMPDRTIIQWDKDDLESMKLLKVDCLALGMLTCLRKCIDLLHDHGLWGDRPCVGDKPSLVDIPQDDDQAVYDMICKADTIGVFQIESRAQMSMLPRLKPREFYDLVIEVAIVRPGPIQGNMVHPYLQRRKNPNDVEYPRSRRERELNAENPRVKDVLKRTLGVPIFQEQVMKLIEVVASFTASQADELRRAMAAWKRKGGLEKFGKKIRKGMLANGYEEEYFERIFEQIKGFGEYGFPESHSYSFALLAWASCWLKFYHPAAFTCALINSQPMGFYQPSQLIQDAQRHGVRVLPADVAVSTWDCTLERQSNPKDDEEQDGKICLRLGLRLLKGMREELAKRLVHERELRPFSDVADLTHRLKLTTQERACMADGGALRSLSGHRYRARWESAGAELPLPVLSDTRISEQDITIRPPSLREDVMNDYARTGLSLTLHPLALIRQELARKDIFPASYTTDERLNGRRIHCAGLVTVRQHPGTAKGVTFVTLEDETGHVNVIVWESLAKAQHRILLESSVMGVKGQMQASEGVFHLVAEELFDYSHLLPKIHFESRDFH
jgi:error-prone DNA polymerase